MAVQSKGTVVPGEDQINHIHLHRDIGRLEGQLQAMHERVASIEMNTAASNARIEAKIDGFINQTFAEFVAEMRRAVSSNDTDTRLLRQRWSILAALLAAAGTIGAIASHLFTILKGG